MAVVRDIQPWDELLRAGREDERLVMQAAENRRPGKAVALPEELHPDVVEGLAAAIQVATSYHARISALGLGNPGNP